MHNGMSRGNDDDWAGGGAKPPPKNVEQNQKTDWPGRAGPGVRRTTVWAGPQTFGPPKPVLLKR